MPKGRIVFTVDGERLVTEAGPDRCWHSEEIAVEDDVDLEDGTVCDICEEEIV